MRTIPAQKLTAAAAALCIQATTRLPADVQAALDAPRFQWTGGKHVQLEREGPAHSAQELARRGHEVEIVNSNLHMGRGQIIWKTDNGLYIGGTEPRCDGAIAAW